MLHSRLLRYLDEVARAGSIRAASDKLNVAASSIWRQIVELERELGSPIFDRLHRKLRLSPTGEILIAHIRRTIKDYERAQEQIEELKGLRIGKVSVALLGGLATSFTNRIVSTFREHHPRLTLAFKRLDFEGILSSLLSGESDLGVSFRIPDDPRLEVVASINCYIGAVVARDHPLAERSSVRISDCVGFPMVLPDETMIVRQTINPVFERLRVRNAPILESNSIEMIRSLVASGQGLSFLNQINIHDERLQGTIRFLPIIDQCPPTVLKIARRSGQNVTLASTILAEAIRSAVQELEPGGASK